MAWLNQETKFVAWNLDLEKHDKQNVQFRFDFQLPQDVLLKI